MKQRTIIAMTAAVLAAMSLFIVVGAAHSLPTERLVPVRCGAIGAH